jgi:carbonic anhydrase/acetyltransferase-like protein (isoleucine patch superfamily)
LVMGSPGKVKRALTAEDSASIDRYWNNYVGYKRDYKNEAGDEKGSG